jgi:hypothetical protein
VQLPVLLCPSLAAVRARVSTRGAAPHSWCGLQSPRRRPRSARGRRGRGCGRSTHDARWCEGGRVATRAAGDPATGDEGGFGRRGDAERASTTRTRTLARARWQVGPRARRRGRARSGSERDERTTAQACRGRKSAQLGACMDGDARSGWRRGWRVGCCCAMRPPAR